MADLQLPSGAYLIRNKQTGTCLEYLGDFKEVRTATQDVLHRREQQIWWVEVLLEHEDDPEGPVYSIHNLPARRALDSTSWRGKGVNVCTPKINGQPWQKWRIKRVLDSNEGKVYNIINVHEKATLNIDTTTEGPVNSTVRTSEFATNNRRQCWEFVTPPVLIPPGWVQIRNVSDRSFLQQTYITSPPFLAPELTPSTPLSDRRTWGSQWLLLLERGMERGTANTPQGYWRIKNRLTGGLLRSWVEPVKYGRLTNVCGGEIWKYGSGLPSAAWRFQMQRDGYWNIVNKENSWVLERADGEPTRVRLVKRDSSDGDHRKWEFV